MTQDNELQQRLPPSDRNAELAVLGCMLRDNACIATVITLVRAASFYQFCNQLIFGAITEIVMVENRPADPVTLADYLHERGQTADIGGAAYIIELWEAAPSTGNVAQYAQIVRGFAIKRALIQVGHDIQEFGFEGGDWQDILDRAEKRLYAISSKCRSTDAVHFSKAVQESMERIGKRSEKTSGEGLTTGFPSIDHIIGVMDEGDLVIIGARPSVGKTAFGMGLACVMAEAGTPFFVASIEQRRIELADRTIAAYTPLNTHLVRTGDIGHYADKVIAAGSRVSKLPIWIDDSAEQSVMDIVASMRRHRQQHNVRAVMIDYLQLITPDDDRANRQEQVAKITRRLKIATRELGMVTFLLAQLNRDVDKRADGRPKLSDLRESGAIEQDADIVLLLHPPEETGLQLEVIVAKDRKGARGSAMLAFDKATSRIIEWEGGELP